MPQKKNRSKPIINISDSKEPLFFLIKNGEELPGSSCTCIDDDSLDIDGLQLIEIEVSDKNGGNPFGEEINRNVGEKERPVEY